MPAFRICIIVPPGYQHAHAFTDLALLLKYTLADLGHDCDLTLNNMDENRINILLGYHLLAHQASLRRFRYVPYQLEQLHARQGVYTENSRRILEDAHAVWDYASENQAFLRERGIESHLLVPGYHPSLEVLKAAEQKECEVLFYGSVNERRRKVLAGLHEAGLRVKALFGVYGEQRNRAIERSAMVLNVHHYPMQIFESVRVSFLLNNGVFVVSEQSASMPYAKVGIEQATYDELTCRCGALLESGQRIREGAERMREEFRTFYPMKQMLAAVLERSM